MEVKLTNVFHRTGQAYLNAVNGTGPRIIVNQGGQGSSKTFSTLQVIHEAVKYSPTPLKTTFCSFALPHLKQGVISDFDKICDSFGDNIGLIKSSPQQPTYHLGKSEINCYGIEGNIALAHGPRRDILFINECNRKVSYEVFDQLASRSQIIFLDYNPDQEFWLQEKVLPNFPHVLIKSNYLDNPYLSANELQNILMKKDNPMFANWWRVYGLGEMGKLEGCIFPNWVYGPFPAGLPVIFGLDFGFNDPDAMVKMAFDHKQKICYWHECFYVSGNSSDSLKKLIAVHCKPNDRIIADSADARMIAELRRPFNIHPTNKGKSGWGVAEAIKVMQGYQHIVTEDSPNLTKEFNNYIWSDKKAGVPIDAFHHLLDGGRYAFQDSKTGGGAQKWSG